VRITGLTTRQILSKLRPAAPRLLLALALVAIDVHSSRGQQPAPADRRTAQPQLAKSTVTVSPDGNTTTVSTGTSLFPACDPPELCNPWLHPPGTNMLPTIWTNAYDSSGNEMLNTLPSTPDIPYNLQDGEPTVSKINITSPQDDLKAFFNAILYQAQTLNNKSASTADAATAARHLQTAIQLGLDVLEGNPFPSRAYSGFPLLHWRAGEQVKKVDPATHNVDIHQVWYDTHIESDTAYLDVSAVKTVPWTITYTVDVLRRGHDDFSPFVMYFDDPALSPGAMAMPNVGMDQSFYNMEDGTRTVFKIKMAQGKYYDLTYTWGWRAHPPRVQVTENGCKTVPYTPPPDPLPPNYDCTTAPNSLVSWERNVFFNNGKPDKAYAIGKISKYAPAKRMWIALNEAHEALARKDYAKIIELFRTERDSSGQPGIAWQAWDDWRDRTRLPRGLPKSLMDAIDADKESDLSLVYMNNTIYAHFTDGGRMDYPQWTVRPGHLNLALYNLDYFDHGYQNVDFGGARGWDNQFQSSVKSGGSGCWFTFGRAYWNTNIPPVPALAKNAIPGTVTVKAATPASAPEGDDAYGWHKLQITYNYEPSKRLRFYQFDPVHHDVAVFSVH
jgi:hypothetical protein